MIFKPNPRKRAFKLLKDIAFKNKHGKEMRIGQIVSLALKSSDVFYFNDEKLAEGLEELKRNLDRWPKKK